MENISYIKHGVKLRPSIPLLCCFVVNTDMAAVPSIPQIIKLAKRRKQRTDCTVPMEVREVMEPFKAAYKAQVNKHGRAHIFRTQILPAVFNYWYRVQDYARNEEECCERMKVFTVPELHITSCLKTLSSDVGHLFSE